MSALLNKVDHALAVWLSGQLSGTYATTAFRPGLSDSAYSLPAVIVDSASAVRFTETDGLSEVQTAVHVETHADDTADADHRAMVDAVLAKFEQANSTIIGALNKPGAGSDTRTVKGVTFSGVTFADESPTTTDGGVRRSTLGLICTVTLGDPS